MDKDAEPISDRELEEFLSRLKTVAERHSLRLEKVENRLGLHPGFFRLLLDDRDDWGFVIKVSVVVESALNDLICRSLIDSGMRRHVHALPMDGRIGKIKLAQDLNLLQEANLKRLQALISIRNDFAHGLETIKVSLVQYFSLMPRSQFVPLMLDLIGQTDSKGTTQIDKKKQKVATDGRIGRFIIWVGACLAILEFSRHQQLFDIKHGWREALTILGHAFLSESKGDRELMRQHIGEALSMLENLYPDSQPKI